MMILYRLFMISERICHFIRLGAVMKYNEVTYVSNCVDMGIRMALVPFKYDCKTQDATLWKGVSKGN